MSPIDIDDVAKSTTNGLEPGDRCRVGEWVCAVDRAVGAQRCGVRNPGGDCGDRHEAGIGKRLEVRPESAVVVGVADGDHGHAVLLQRLQGEGPCPLDCELREPALGIDANVCGGDRLGSRLGGAVEVAGVQRLDDLWHAEDAVAEGSVALASGEVASHDARGFGRRAGCLQRAIDRGDQVVESDVLVGVRQEGSSASVSSFNRNNVRVGGVTKARAGSLKSGSALRVRGGRGIAHCASASTSRVNQQLPAVLCGELARH